MMDPKLSIAWEAYQKSICNGLSLLQQRGEFVDMTLAADGHRVKVHQMVLSLVSPYIKDLITSASCQHPVIFLNKVPYSILQSILEYAYTGEVMVTREDLGRFLEISKELHIRGLEGDNVQIKGTDGSGDLLQLIGAQGGEDPENPQRPGEKPVRIPYKLRKTQEPQPTEYLDDDFGHDDDHQMDDHALDDVEETIIEEQVENDNRTLQVKKESDPREKSIQSAPMVQYSLSNQGNVQMILNRYIYSFRHLRKTNERVWRCRDYEICRCDASAVTKDDIVVHRGRAHKHPFHDKQILKRVHNQNIYTSYKSIEQLSLLTKNKNAADKKNKNSSK